jgi:hypothetical protein
MKCRLRFQSFWLCQYCAVPNRAGLLRLVCFWPGFPARCPWEPSRPASRAGWPPPFVGLAGSSIYLRLLSCQCHQINLRWLLQSAESGKAPALLAVPPIDPGLHLAYSGHLGEEVFLVRFALRAEELEVPAGTCCTQKDFLFVDAPTRSAHISVVSTALRHLVSSGLRLECTFASLPVSRLHLQTGRARKLKVAHTSEDQELGWPPCSCRHCTDKNAFSVQRLTISTPSRLCMRPSSTTPPPSVINISSQIQRPTANPGPWLFTLQERRRISFPIIASELNYACGIPAFRALVNHLGSNLFNRTAAVTESDSQLGLPA